MKEVVKGEQEENEGQSEDFGETTATAKSCGMSVNRWLPWTRHH